MDITVVIATYNQLHRLKLVLAGLRQQTFPPDRFEIIVVDDGCTDDTSVMLEQVRIPNLRTIHLYPNQGRCRARNAGITHSVKTIPLYLASNEQEKPPTPEQTWQPGEFPFECELLCECL